MRHPTDIVASAVDRQLYVADDKSIWRVSVENGSYVKWLSTETSTNIFRANKLSVSSRGLLVTSTRPAHLREYSMTDKELLRVVDLPSNVGCLYHGVETTRGTFVIGHSCQSLERAVSELFCLVVTI